MLKIIESVFNNGSLIDFRCCGVYGIRHNDSGRIYIGSSKNVRSRLNHHLAALLLKKHHSRHLQKAWDKYGQSTFSVVLLEKGLSEKILIEKEQFWIDHFNSYKKGFNAKPRANSFLGLKWTESQKNKIRGYRRGTWTASSHIKASETLKRLHAENPDWRKNAQKWLHSPKNEAKRIAAFKATFNRPEIRSAFVRRLLEASNSPTKNPAVRKAYFEKFNRKSLGFKNPEEMDQACLKLHLEGKSCREIGRLFHIDHHGISSRLRRLGVALKRDRQYARHA